jgi:predicted metal-dependent hydrolase
MPFEPFEPLEPLDSTEVRDLPDAANQPDPSNASHPSRPGEESRTHQPAATVTRPGATKQPKADEEPSEPTEKPSPLEVRIVRSARRKKSVGAQIKDGVVEVTVPMWMSRTEADRFAEQFRKRFEKARASTSVDLAARARSLSRTYGLPKPLSIRWVTNQNSRWGSCTPTDSTIRINNRLAKVPTWVLDYVIVHEICHLRHPNHSAEFWALVNTYPLTERARGFLLGMGMVEDGAESEDGEGA